MREAHAALNNADECRRLLHEIDHTLTRSPDGGETTGIIVVADSTGVFGAGVGDSAAWFFSAGGKEELSLGQMRKPLLGTGVALAHTFVRNSLNGTLVVATDGLWKYTSLESIEQRVRSLGISGLAAQLVELVRLRSGTFPDDVAIVTCRFTSPIPA